MITFTHRSRKLALGLGFAVALGALQPVAHAIDATTGFAPVGRIPDTERHLSNADGALLMDPVHRRAYEYYTDAESNGTPYVQFRTYDLDTIRNGSFVELPPVRVNPDTLTATSGDDTRISVDEATYEPVATIDPTTGRLFYSGGGSLYELDPATRVLHKWVAPPNPGGVDEHQVRIRSGVPQAFVPSGLTFDETRVGPRLYTVGSFTTTSKGVWVSAWDAKPTPKGVTTPQARQLWTYPVRTCTTLNQGKIKSLVFRSGDWLYLFCDGSTDQSARGVIRLHLATTGEPQPDNTEQFFPGVTGVDPVVQGDPLQERVYVTSSNLRGGRSTLVFDGTASGNVGAYIGQVALSQAQSPPLGSGVDPMSGRWYFSGPEGLWYQDGRLKRVAQAIRFDHDAAGASLQNAQWRPIAVDSGHTPRRVFVQKGDGYVAYEDRSPQPSPALPPTERTNGQPEGPGMVGVYSGVTSAYGLRLRVMRGLSTLWPAGPNGVLESPAGTDPTKPVYYATDPFFNHGGDCGTSDREVTIGRILPLPQPTHLDGGLANHEARASALAIDPDVHHRSSRDDTQTRDDASNPDPCVQGLVHALTGATTPSSNFKSTGAGAWPYPLVACEGNDNKQATTTAPATTVVRVKCAATGDAPGVEADTSTALSPSTTDAVVKVAHVDTSAASTRKIGDGLTSTSSADLRGITIANGAVLLDELLETATAHAGGRPGTATTTVTRQFLGLTVNGVRVCQVCDEATVLENINAVIGPYGYARVPKEEPDKTVGTTKGTLAVVQKNVLQQDADATVNRDESAELPGIEIGVYRDSQSRAGGRWILQLGGVFASAQFGVIDGLSGEVSSIEAAPVADTTVTPDVPVVAGEITAAIEPPTVPRPSPVSRPRPLIGTQIARQVLRSVGFAVRDPARAGELALAWLVVWSPLYVAVRRRQLKDSLHS